MFEYSESVCVICRNPFVGEGDQICLTGKGVETLTMYSDLHKDTELQEYLLTRPERVIVHVSCRKKYTNKRRLEQQNQSTSEASVSVPAKTLRSSVGTFDWKIHCFFCGEFASQDSRYPNSADTVSVRTLEMKNTLVQESANRTDSWTLEVQGRLHTCHDLVAAEAIYHKSCRAKFFNLQTHKSGGNIGRPEQSQMSLRFEQLCDWLEAADDELYTLYQLQEKLCSLSEPGEDVYSLKQMKRKLQDKYEDHIFFAEISGRKNVVCFRNMAARIINDKWYKERSTSIEDESIRIVVAAAKLIKAQIRECDLKSDEYPKTSEFNNLNTSRAWIPNLLMTFLKNIINSELKQISIGHCVVQATRPRSAISPVLFGIGVSLDHLYGSRILLDMLSRLGFSISNDEVVRYKQSVVQSDKLDMPESYDNAFTQWSGDNVDHNVKTLDGTGTFHGMGVISMTTPCHRLDPGNFYTESSVKRLQRSTVSGIIKNRGIPIVYYSAPDQSSLSKLLFQPIAHLQSPYVMPPSINLDLVWHTGWFFTDAENPQPSWAGFMHDVTPQPEYFTPPSDIRFLPIIDLNPNDMSCIYSTLLFIERQSRNLNQETACITCDQPLWFKAVEIVMSTNLNIVCRLGAFHTIMSFFRSVGSIMDGSGLSEALQCCYGPNAVTHMLTGKAVERAVRGHFLVEAALSILLLKDLLHSSADENANHCSLREEDVHNLDTLYNQVVTKEFDFTTDLIPDCFDRLNEALENYKKQFKMCRTACLWLQYVEYVSILKTFIRAERTGDWHLHLHSLTRMLNLFAATGHTNYAKSSRLYLQFMSQLPTHFPWLYHQFTAGRFHSIRRSNRFWTGLSTDLVIEQVMMRSIKSRGGLTHGRGMSESVRLMWVATMHQNGTVYAALTKLMNLDHSSDDDGYADMGKSRRFRDLKDLTKIIEWFESSNPFQVLDCRLHSLSSGKAASDSDGINCDVAEDVGRLIMKKMDGIPVGELVLKKVDQARTLADVSDKARVGHKKLLIDSNILFSRLLIVMQRSSDMEPFFTYELTAEPTALFKDSGLRKTEKSALAKELRKKINLDLPVSEVKRYVVDGGWLLHRVKWLQGASFADIIKEYVDYVNKHFGTNATIVFDGYGNGPSTKDHEHDRRSLKAAPDFIFEENKPCCCSQAGFLANENNKKAFVESLINNLIRAGHTIQQAIHDADTLIVKAALQVALTGPVTVVSNDTDVLVLLIYHFEFNMGNIFVRADGSKKNSNKVIVSIRELRNAIGEEAAHQILVLHAISGCDTTSSLYGLGKGTVWKRLIGNQEAIQLCQILNDSTASHSDISTAGLKILALMYGGKTNENLNHMRYVMYMNYAASSTVQLRPERLPPTENASRYHIYRVHLQVVQWNTLMSTELNAEEWGWKLNEGAYVPITTDIPAAPEDLLKIIRCKCKVETQRPCSTQLCSCLKHGLTCVAACKNCNGELCNNTDLMTVSQTEGNEDLDNEDLNALFQEVIMEEDLEFELPWFDEEVVETSSTLKE